MTLTAVQLVYIAAGHPQRDDFKPIGEPCWWCGHNSLSGLGWPLKRLSSTFPWAEQAQCPTSTVVCDACAWSMATGFDLPRAYAEERLHIKAEQGRRVDLMEDGERVKRLALLLEDGRVGLWKPGGRPAAEKPWKDALSELRTAPRTVGPCAFLGAYALEDLTPGPDRFVQSFHHILVDGVWSCATDGDKPRLREHLLRDDIVGPAVTSLALEQGKHTLIRTHVEHPEHGVRTIYAWGCTLHYRAGDLRELLHAVELLIACGAHHSEVESGEYAGSADPRRRAAVRALDPRVAPHRGGLLLTLALYLRRPTEELRADVDRLLRLPPEPEGAGAAAPPAPTTSRDDAPHRGGVDLDRDRRAGAQLDLWG